MEEVGELMEVLGKEAMGVLDIHGERNSNGAHVAQGTKVFKRKIQSTRIGEQ
jgi:hypothetical protein